MLPAAELVLRPSAADTWLRCTAQPRLLRRLVRASLVSLDASDEYADEGVEVHVYAAQCIGNWLAQEEPPTPPATLTKEDDALLDAHYLQPIRDVFVRLSPTHYGVERKAPLWYMARTGTVDFWYYDIETRTLHVWDLKWGIGVAVQPDSYQLRVYATALWLELRHDFDIEWVDLSIVQPRQRNPLRTMRILPTALIEFMGEATKVARRIISNLKGTVSYAPSTKACRWCRAEPYCPEKLRMAKEAANQMKEGAIETIATEVLDPRHRALALERLREAADIVDVLDTWVRSVRKALFVTLSQSVGPADWKLIDGSEGIRRWRDPNKVAKVLEMLDVDEDVYTTTELRSPAQLEKALREVDDAQLIIKALQPLIERKQGQPKVVRSSDPRPQFDRLELARKKFSPVKKQR